MRKLILIAVVISMAAACSKAETSNNHKSTNQTKENMKTIHLTKEEFFTKVANLEANPKEWNYLGDKPCIIDFYASWCGPCKAIAPILEELAAEYANEIYIYKVNTEEEQELATMFSIRSIPSLLFVPMNESPQMSQGAMSKDQFKKMINSVLLKK